jgi:glutathione S-transferase
MPRDAKGEAETLQWVIASLNSLEMVTAPRWHLGVKGAKGNGLTGWAQSRLSHWSRCGAIGSTWPPGASPWRIF